MTPDERKAVSWAVKLLDGFFGLTGMEPKPESRPYFDTLRKMVKP